MNKHGSLLEQTIIGGYFLNSNLEKGFTYMPGMYVEPFSRLLYILL